MKKEDLENIQKIVEDIDEGWNPFQGWGPFLTQAQKREINAAEKNRSGGLTAAQKAQVLAQQRAETRRASRPEVDTSKGERSVAANTAKQKAAVAAHNKPIDLRRQPGSDPFAPLGSSTNPRPGQSLPRTSALAPGRAGDFGSSSAPKPEKTYNVGDYGSLTKSQINQKYKQLSGDEAVKFGKVANQAIYKWNEGVESGPILPGEKGKRVFPKGQEPKPTGAKLPPLQNAGYEPEGEQIDEAKYGTKKGRKKLAAKIRKGENIGKKGPGTGFKAVERAAEKGGAEDPTAVAAAAMWKNLASSYEPEGELTEKMIYDIIIEYLVSNGHAEDLHEAHYLIERHDVDSLVRIVESCGCEHGEMEDEEESNKKKKKKVSEEIQPTSEVERHPDGSMTQQTIDKKTGKKGPPIKLAPPGDGTNGTRLTIPFSNSAPGAEQGHW